MVAMCVESLEFGWAMKMYSVHAYPLHAKRACSSIFILWNFHIRLEILVYIERGGLISRVDLYQKSTFRT